MFKEEVIVIGLESEDIGYFFFDEEVERIKIVEDEIFIWYVIGEEEEEVLVLFLIFVFEFITDLILLFSRFDRILDDFIFILSFIVFEGIEEIFIFVIVEDLLDKGVEEEFIVFSKEDILFLYLKG